MFTIEQIQTAHASVRSGADFPRYIRDLITLGVERYETYVVDGHTGFYGKGAYHISSPAKYNSLVIAGESDEVQFKEDLKSHQQGHTDYLTFCSDCASSGIEKWVVSMADMTCSYFDKAGNRILTEQIPQ